MIRPEVLVTIVTVCRNAGEKIDVTAASVAAQKKCTLEWVVVDGASADDTVRRAEAWRGRIAGDVRIVSEPDCGIYDAMNKGLHRARGKWVLFLNAGDAFCSDTSLLGLWAATVEGGVFVSARSRQYDPCDGSAYIVGEAFSWAGVAAGKIPPHQTCLYLTRAVLDAGGYRLEMGLAADTDLTVRLARKGPVAYLSQVVVDYPLDGLSSRPSWFLKPQRDKLKAVWGAAPRRTGCSYVPVAIGEMAKAVITNFLALVALRGGVRKMLRRLRHDDRRGSPGSGL